MYQVASQWVYVGAVIKMSPLARDRQNIWSIVNRWLVGSAKTLIYRNFPVIGCHQFHPGYAVALFSAVIVKLKCADGAYRYIPDFAAYTPCTLKHPSCSSSHFEERIFTFRILFSFVKLLRRSFLYSNIRLYAGLFLILRINAPPKLVTEYPGSLLRIAQITCDSPLT